MIAGVFATAILCIGIYGFVSSTPAPRYEMLVKTILSGEADDFADATRAVASVEKRNPELANRYSFVLKTFSERARVNLKAGQRNTTSARLLVRVLSTEDHGSWADHPLRLHALAEAYSLLANALKQREPKSGKASVFGDLSSDTLFDNSIELYRKVADSNDPRAVPQLRASALKNLGNTLLYRNEYANALTAWRRANSESLGLRSTSTWGNIVAGLVILGRYDEAVAEGEAARDWAESNGKALQETSQFVSIIVNMAFARLATRDLPGAVSDFRFADALQEDANTKLNLALAYILSGQTSEAKQVLRAVAPPVDQHGQALVATSSKEKRCAQLMWFLAEPNVSPIVKAARLYVFRGQAFSASEFSSITPDDVSVLRGKVADWLPQFPGACATLAHFDIVNAEIRGDRF